MPPHPTSFAERRREFVKELGGKALWRLERFIASNSTIGDDPFIDPAHFPWVRQLEENWRTIRKELDDVLEYREDLPSFHEISTDQAVITSDDRWKTFFFYGMGYPSERNCARCPETARLVASIPGMKTAFFSILSPHKHIPAHRGLFKGFVRYHLGLKVPEPREACRIRVGNEVAHWEEGKGLFFDDTYDHEVWNDTDGIRVVLFVDFLRPLRFPASVINRGLVNIVRHTDYVLDSKRNHEAWETKQMMNDVSK